MNLFYNAFSSVFMNMYLFNNNPYKLNMLNNFEKLNEIYTLLLSYTLIVFSNFVHDPEAKYTLGWWFIGSLMLNGCINISIITYDLAIGFYRNARKG